MIEIKEGTILTIKVLRWSEDWEFGYPTVILTPVRRYSPNGESIEEMVESLGIDASVDGKLNEHDYDQEFAWRGWSWKNLERVYRLAMKGKTFPIKNYKAAEFKMTFYLDKHDEIMFRLEEVQC